jgi:hypothetical protein
MADSSDSKDDLGNSSLDSKDRRRSGDLDARQTPTRVAGGDDDLDGKSKPIPAWQLRERMKSQMPSSHPVRKITSNPIARTPRDFESNRRIDDPSLPPAFRAAFAANKKKEVDDFMSMDSVHSSKSHMSILTATPTSPDSFLDDSSSTFDGHDSFASLGSDDDEDDDAYREGRNQIARQQMESSKPKSMSLLKNKDFRLKRGGGLNGVGGAPLDFIAE